MIRAFLTYAALALFAFGANGAFAEIVEAPAGAALEEGAEAATDVPVEGALADTEHAEGEHHEAGGSSGGLPQLDPTWYPSQIFWLAVTFSLLYVVFSRKVLPDISKTIEKRQTHIQDDLDVAARLRADAEESQKIYEELLNGASQKVAERMMKMETEIKDKQVQAMEELRARTLKAVEATEKEAMKAKDKVMGEIHEIVAEVANEAAGKIAGIKTDLAKAKSVVKNIDKKAA